MKYLIVIAFFIFSIGNSYANSLFQEQYRSHRVEKGETIFSISQKYKISETAIYRLNPDARNGISERSVLILPTSSTQVVVLDQDVKFKKHRVRRKETLYSIAKKYKISEDDIKKYNKHLYSKGLKKGEKLQIPIFSIPQNTSVIGSSDLNTGDTGVRTKIHIIQPKETKYGIARRYGVSIAELERLNPLVPEGFPIGTELRVPDVVVTESATIEEGAFDFYEVKPKEGFFRLKVKLGLTQEEIIALNPYAKDGLKDGMILKIPKDVSDRVTTTTNTINLEDGILNREAKHLAVMLPFQLQKMEADELGPEHFLEVNRTSRIALDFYSGVLMAAEFAKDQGISVVIDMHDTEGNNGVIDDIVSQEDFTNTQAVIGPLLSKNVQKAATHFKNDNIPVFSPLTNRNLKLTSNLFQTLPGDDLLVRSMIDYLKKNSDGKKVIVIGDKTKAKSKAAILAALPGATVLEPREKGFLYVVDIQEKMDKVRENWVILESTDPVIVSNVVGLLNGMPAELKIRLFTTDMNDTYDYDEISNMHLAHLNFTFPSVSKSYNYRDKTPFVVSYKNEYGVLPNRFAVRGFDVTYDVILRLAAEGNVYDAGNEDFETEYIENKFKYQKKMFSGYTNNAFYILKYNQDLELEVIK